MLKFASYVRPNSAEEAYELLQQKKGSKIVGGGLWLRLGKRTLPCAIDLSACGLDGIEETEDAFVIGAMVSLHAVEQHEGFAAATGGIFSRAVRDIVGVQFREMATAGGSLYGRFGFSDVLCALLALDCEVELVGAGRLPLEEFAARPYERDVLKYLVVRKHDYRAAYQCLRKAATDFPVVNASAALWDGAWHVAVGARPARARLLDAEALSSVSAEPTLEELERVVDAARSLTFSSNMWASAGYRRHLAGVMVVRALCAAADIDIPSEVQNSLEVRA